MHESMKDDARAIVPATSGRPEAAAGPECPVCACPIEGPPRLCPRCETPHHDDCWDYAGGCAVYGCDTQRWTRTDPAAFEEVAGRIRAWSRLFQAQWWSFAAAAAGVLVIVTLVTAHLALFEPLSLFTGATAKAILGLICVCAFATSTLGTAAYLGLLLPVWYHRRTVHDQTGIRLLPPSGQSKRLGDVTADQPAGRFLRRMVWVFGAALASLILVGTPLRASFAGIGLAHCLATFLILSFLPWMFLLGVSRATARRFAFLESVRNRLLTSVVRNEKDPGFKD